MSFLGLLFGCGHDTSPHSVSDLCTIALTRVVRMYSNVFAVSQSDCASTVVSGVHSLTVAFSSIVVTSSFADMGCFYFRGATVGSVFYTSWSSSIRHRSDQFIRYNIIVKLFFSSKLEGISRTQKAAKFSCYF